VWTRSCLAFSVDFACPGFLRTRSLRRRVTDRRVPWLIDIAGGGFPLSKLRRGYPAGDTFEETARPEGASLHRRKPRVDRRCDPRHGPDHDRLHQLVSARPPAGAHQMTEPHRRRVHRSVDGGQRIVIGLKRRENQRIGGKSLPTWVTNMRSVLRFISILPCRRPRTGPAPAPVRQHRFRVSHLGTSPPTWDGRGRHGSRLERS
jgi:hypothetical protein